MIMKRFIQIITLLFCFVSCDYNYYGEFNDGLQIVSRNANKYGFANENNEIVIPCKYDYVHNFNNGYACCEIKDKWGVIDSTGQTVIPFKYDKVNSLTDGVAVLYQGGLYGAVNVKGETVAPFKYDYIGAFTGGYAISYIKDRYGVLSADGRRVVKFRYDEISSINEGYAVCKDHNGWWIEKLDSNRPISKEKFDQEHSKMVGRCVKIRPVSEGLAAYEWRESEDNYSERHRKWGFINTLGEVVVPCEYQKVGDYHEGFAWVKQGAWYSFVDKSGQRLQIKDEKLKNHSFTAVSDFSNGYATVRFLLEDYAYKVYTDGRIEKIITEADRARDRHIEKYHWIKGKWAFVTPYGTAIYNFDGNGESGSFTEASYGVYETGSYVVSGNTLKCDYGSHIATFDVDFYNHTISSGGYKLTRKY